MCGTCLAGYVASYEYFFLSSYLWSCSFLLSRWCVGAGNAKAKRPVRFEQVFLALLGELAEMMCVMDPVPVLGNPSVSV